MIFTDVKIEVTDSMLYKANMIRGNQIGIPVDLDDLSKGLRWKDLFQVTDEDYDTIEEYFLRKSK